MLASSFHHWTSTSDSPRRANSTSCRLHVGWPGKRSALTRSGMTERSWGRRRRTSIPTPLSAGGPYRGPARRVVVVGAATVAVSLCGPATGRTGGALAWETGIVTGLLAGGGAAGVRREGGGAVMVARGVGGRGVGRARGGGSKLCARAGVRVLSSAVG